MSRWCAKIVVGCVISLAFPSLSARAVLCGPAAYDCALYHVARHEFGPAIRYLEKSLKAKPGDLKALNLMGIALTGSGQIEKANHQFRRALEINPRFYPALKNLAVNELTMKRTAEAKAHFEQVLKLAPQDEVAHLSLAEIHFVAKQCAPALEHYEKSRMRIVNDPDLIIHYSKCSLEQSQIKAATTMLDLLPPGDAAAQFHAGEMLGRAEAFGEAAKHFGMARPKYPDPYVAGYNQTLMLVRGGAYPAAVRVAQELIAHGYERSELYNLASEAYLKNDQIKEAYDALRKATQIEPKEESNYVDLAAICLDYANYDLGLEITEIGLRHLPKSDRLYLQRGVMRAMKGQVEEAEKDFTAAQELSPEKALPYVALGIAWMQMGRIQKAVEVLRQQAELNPKDFLVHYLLGEALVRSGPEAGSAEESEAIAAFEKSARLYPGFVHSRAGLGKLLLKRGEVDRAIVELEKAVELDPTETSPAFQLAQAYRRKGDNARADAMMARLGELHQQEREGYMDKALKRIVKEGAPAFSTGRGNP